MALIYAEGDNPHADAAAKAGGEALAQAYPNHSWRVEVRSGVLIVKHFDISGLRGNIGMIRHLDQLSHDSAVFKREVIMAAGELLERAGLRRGANDGSEVHHLELDRDVRRHWHAPLMPIKVIH